jgi:ABC-type multidrug transport system permease subunit
MAKRFTTFANEALFFVIPGTKVILMFLLITSVYNTSQMSLPPVPYMLMPLTIVAGTIFFLCCYPPMGFFHATSEECLHHWCHKARTSFKMKVLILMYRKTWLSLPPIGIWVGPFYVIRQKTVLVFFSVVAYYVMTLLCSA